MNVRIYKDNIRENIFRSLLFTDIVIFVLAGVIIAILTYLFFSVFSRHFNWSFFLGTLTFLEILLYSIALLHIDKQPIYKIITRAVPFAFNKKKFRADEVDPYFKDFTIQDDLIVRRKSISKIFEIISYDISAINAGKRQDFFASVKLALHTLPSQLQIIIRKEEASISDFTDHFFHLYRSVRKEDRKRQDMIHSYQRDLSEFIQQEQVLTIKQYGVFSVKTDTLRPKEKVQAIGKLTDMYMRLNNAFELCKVKTRQLISKELERQMVKILR